MKAIETPVAFFAFNRPDLTARVFERIREARPTRLLVVCDGPRETHPDDPAKVEAVRRVVDNVNWPCEVKREYSDTNLGCRRRVASGLNWVFEQVEEAIILEDDTLPDSSFFPYCRELLERYRDDVRVMHIGGYNLGAPHMRQRESYWFTRHAWIWGWATWRRAWRLYDFEMNSWEERLTVVERTFASRWERQYWFSAWAECRKDPAKANTWDFPWMYSVRAADGVAILPSVNLVENLGFGDDGTHTTAMLRHNLIAESITGVVHPGRLEVRRGRDELLTRVYSGDSMGLKSDVRSCLRRLRDGICQADFGVG